MTAMQPASHSWDPSSTYDHPVGGDPWCTRPERPYLHAAIELTASPTMGAGRGWVAKEPIAAGELVMQEVVYSSREI